MRVTQTHIHTQRQSNERGWQVEPYLHHSSCPLSRLSESLGNRKKQQKHIEIPLLPFDFLPWRHNGSPLLRGSTMQRNYFTTSVFVQAYCTIVCDNKDFFFIKKGKKMMQTVQQVGRGLGPYENSFLKFDCRIRSLRKYLFVFKVRYLNSDHSDLFSH